MCVCTVVVAKCKVAAAFRDNQGLTSKIQMLLEQLLHSMVLALKKPSLLQRAWRFFSCICLLHSATVSRKGKKKMKTGYLPGWFLGGPLSLPWWRMASPSTSPAACLGLTQPEQTLLLTRSFHVIGHSHCHFRTQLFPPQLWARLLCLQAQTFWFLLYSGLKCPLMREELVLSNGLYWSE